MIIILLTILYIAFILFIGLFIMAIQDGNADGISLSFLLMFIFGVIANGTHSVYNKSKYTTYNTINRTTVPIEHRNNISIVVLNKYTYTDSSLLFRQSDSAYVDSIQVLYKNNIKDTIIKVQVKINES